MAGSALGRGQRSGWEGVAEGAAQGRGASHSHRTCPLGERAGVWAGCRNSHEQPPGPRTQCLANPPSLSAPPLLPPTVTAL